MGDFAYARKTLEDGRSVGAHSIDIILDNGSKINTWDNYFLAPMARPFVAAPAVKTEYINVPGADGALDYTEALTGKPRYANRSGQWQFIMENDHFDWPVVMSDILNKLHGKHCKIVLTDDPEYYYIGRIQVQVGFGNKDYSSVVISYNLDPYKYPVSATAIANWRWSELFGNTIYYGNFSVNGVKAHTILNDSGSEKICTINTSNAIQVYKISSTDELFDMFKEEFEGYESRWLAIGDNEYTLDVDENILVFRGNALIKISYERGKTL